MPARAVLSVNCTMRGLLELILLTVCAASCNATSEQVIARSPDGRSIFVSSSDFSSGPSASSSRFAFAQSGPIGATGLLSSIPHATIFAPAPPVVDDIPPAPTDASGPETRPPHPPFPPRPRPPPPPPPVPIPSSFYHHAIDPVTVAVGFAPAPDSEKEMEFFPATDEYDSTGNFHVDSPTSAAGIAFAPAPAPREEPQGVPFSEYGPPKIGRKIFAKSVGVPQQEFNEISSEFGGPSAAFAESIGHDRGRGKGRTPAGSETREELNHEFTEISSDFDVPSSLTNKDSNGRFVFSHLIGGSLFDGPQRNAPLSLATSDTVRLQGGSYSYVSRDGVPVNIRKIRLS